MNFDSNLAEILNEYIEIFFDEEYLEQLWFTWSKQRDEGNLVSFNDFVFGSLNGSLTALYCSYNGKNVLSLGKEDYKVIRKLLNNWYGGLEKIVLQFQEKNRANNK